MSPVNKICRRNPLHVSAPARLGRDLCAQNRAKSITRIARYLLLPLITLVSPAGVTGEFPGIEELMSEEECQATGLGQLTPGQMEALDRWLLNYTAGASQVLQSNEAVKSASQGFEISSRLAGSFSGWSGETVFLLENGQRWKQRLSGRYIYQGPPNPHVTITRNFFGYYMMTLIEEERAVGVSPMQ